MNSKQLYSGYMRLSTREIEVCALIAEGLPNEQIGQELFIGLRTVEHHINSIFTKLGLPVGHHKAMRVSAAKAHWMFTRTIIDSDSFEMLLIELGSIASGLAEITARVSDLRELYRTLQNHATSKSEAPGSTTTFKSI